jgi:hypothetical protein
VSDKRPADPNATIQIDLSHIQLEDIVLPGAAAKAEQASRSEPPPLPPPSSTLSTLPAPANRGRAIAMVVLFVVLLVAAIVVGLRVGARVRGASPSENTPSVAS